MSEAVGGWVRVGNPGRPSDGGTRYGTLAEREPILLVRTGGRLYATQARCGHMKFPLGNGKLEGAILKCPLHGARFDLATGAVVSGPHVPWPISGMKMGQGILSVPADSLRTYEVEERADGVYVRPRQGDVTRDQPAGVRPATNAGEVAAPRGK